MRVYLAILVMLCSLVTLIAQDVVKVSGEYTYHAPIDVSIEQAKAIALERARLQCLADEFGTIVNQSNSTIIRTSNGQTDMSQFSLGGTEVKGEWLGDLQSPIYQIRYDELSECNIVHVRVVGKARAITSAKIDIETKLLCNGHTPRHEKESFYEGDQLFMSFLSPVDGYLCVYLVDEEANAFCLLPYGADSNGSQRVQSNKNHLFFSKQLSANPELVDEYVMSCAKDGESNIFYIIFSPNSFSKAVDYSSFTSLQQLSYEDMQAWLLEVQSKDAQLQVIRKTIRINRLK